MVVDRMRGVEQCLVLSAADCCVQFQLPSFRRRDPPPPKTNRHIPPVEGGGFRAVTSLWVHFVFREGAGIVP